MHLGFVQSRAAATAGGTLLTQFGSWQPAADAAAGGTPLMQSGFVHPVADAATRDETPPRLAGAVLRTLVIGGGPPLQSGLPLQALAVAALAGPAARPTEPALRAAASTAPAASRYTRVLSMTSAFRFQRPGATVLSSGGLAASLAAAGCAVTVARTAEAVLKLR
jgi:hypothetical protein